MRRALALLSAAALLAVAPLHAADPAAPAQAATIELSAEASQAAANDLVTAVLYAERNGPNPAAVAREVNRDIAAALEIARARADIKVQSGNTSTWPVYAQDGKGRITAWRMRSEIQLESRNPAAMSELVGELQASLERITPPARMRVDVVPGLVLAIEVVEQFEQYEVLENVGVIAGVEGVTVAEHVGFPMSAGILAPPVVAQNPWRISNIAHRARVFMLHCSCYDARPDCREPPASDIQ